MRHIFNMDLALKFKEGNSNKVQLINILIIIR